MYRVSAFSMVVLTALLVAALPGAAEAAPSPPAFQSALAGAPLAVRTDGAYVAWAESVQPNRFMRFANLYVANLYTGQTQLQLSQLNWSNYAGPFGASLALGGGVLVWRDGAGGAVLSPLVARDLAAGTSWVVAEQGGVFPDIDGQTVAWWEIAPPADGRVMAVLKTRRLAPDAAPAAEQLRLSLRSEQDLRQSRVSGGWAAWVQADSQTPSTCPTLFFMRLGSGDTQTIGDAACYAEQRIPFDMSGERLAYVDHNNLLVERSSPLIEQGRSGPHANLDIALSNRWIFWNHAAAPGPWAFDPVTGSSFQVSHSKLSYSLAASGGVLAWFEQSEASGSYSLQARSIAGMLPDVPRAAGDPELAGRGLFPETGHSLGGEFQNFWNRNGGLPVFGFSLTEEFYQRSADTGATYLVQFFERQRFELHPEHSGTSYVVELGRLGAEALAAQGRDWQLLPKSSPAAPHYFAATSQAIAPEFWEYWRGRGLELGDAGVSEREALALWGYPITPPAYEPLPNGETLLVQWFERARFEYHPNNPDPYKVLLGRLAADRVAGFVWR